MWYFNLRYMKRMLQLMAILVIFLISGCGMSTEKIGKTVKVSMQETLNSDPNLSDYKLKVDKVQVFKQGGNAYKGLVNIVYKGSSHNVTIEITVDGKNVLWEAAPGSFMFIAQEELKQIQHLFE